MKKNIRKRKLERREPTTCRDYVLIQLEELSEELDKAIELNEKLFLENQKLKEELTKIKEQPNEPPHRVVK